MVRDVRVVPCALMTWTVMWAGSSSAAQGGACSRRADPSGAVLSCWYEITCCRTAVTSSGPAKRRARGNARRLSARATQRGSRCTDAPRPGRRPAGSGTRSSPTATTRSREALTAFARQPTHVRSGPGRRAAAESSASALRGRAVFLRRAMVLPACARTVRGRLCGVGGGVAADVDAPAGEPRGKPSVLPLLADRQ